MKNWRSRLIALALVTVAVLAAGALMGHDEALAAPCCSWCDNGYDTCINGCGGDPTCEDGCWTRWRNCFRYCISSC
jgi:hypothetical protein